ncbi:recombinase family protein [Burkholderia multivorans]|uniref:recombinase family protein n=1 Tax=Burkholderia multivorans TaxID=87883 RepID=UPI00285D835C|nr:Transposon gamma-delta resolvase [Burkholderia multivorans]
MSRTKPAAAPMVARVYLRVSTDAQDLERQEGIITAAKAAGYYVAGIYREKASGARADRPELLRMVADLQPGEVVIAEKIDRISRLPLPEAERLVASIRPRVRAGRPWRGRSIRPGGRGPGRRKIVLESVQDMLLKLALQMAATTTRTGASGSARASSWRSGTAATRAGGPIRSCAPR